MLLPTTTFYIYIYYERISEVHVRDFENNRFFAASRCYFFSTFCVSQTPQKTTDNYSHFTVKRVFLKTFVTIAKNQKFSANLYRGRRDSVLGTFYTRST